MLSLDHGSAPSRARRLPRRQASHAVEPVVTLCLSVTPNATELVVVRGEAVLDRVHTPMDVSRLRQVVDTVLQTRKLAIVNGYRVDAIAVIGDGSDGVIAALTDAGLSGVTALDPAVACEIFTEPQDIENAVINDARARARRRWMFAAAMVIACGALLFAVVDRWEAAHRHSDPGEPAVTPRRADTTAPRPPANPVIVIPPPSIPVQEVPEPPPPTRTPTRQAPVQREQPAQQAPPAPPLVEQPESAPAGNCLFLCGVTL